MDPEQRTIAAAYWLYGVYGAFGLRGYPRAVDRHELNEHMAVAFDIVNDGKTFRGPLAICQMVVFAESLSNVVRPKIKLST